MQSVLQIMSAFCSFADTFLRAIYCRTPCVMNVNVKLLIKGQKYFLSVRVAESSGEQTVYFLLPILGPYRVCICSVNQDKYVCESVFQKFPWRTQMEICQLQMSQHFCHPRKNSYTSLILYKHRYETRVKFILRSESIFL